MATMKCPYRHDLVVGDMPASVARLGGQGVCQGSWNRGGAMHMAHWMGGIYHPTHWMPLPPAPEDA
jgi:hypothetical protein